MAQNSSARSTLNRHGSVGPRLTSRGSAVARGAIAVQHCWWGNQVSPTFAGWLGSLGYKLVFAFGLLSAVIFGYLEWSDSAMATVPGAPGPGSPGGAAGGPLNPEQMLVDMQAQLQVQQDMLLQQQTQMQQQQTQMQQQAGQLQMMMNQLADAQTRTERAEEERYLAMRMLSQRQGTEELVDTKGVGQPFKFSGKADQDFAEWDHKMKTFLRAKYEIGRAHV